MRLLFPTPCRAVCLPPIARLVTILRRNGLTNVRLCAGSCDCMTLRAKRPASCNRKARCTPATTSISCRRGLEELGGKDERPSLGSAMSRRARMAR
jgi:hypothetical protein